MLADEVDFVIGVDPHRDRHALAVVDARSGGLVEALRTSAPLARQHRPVEPQRRGGRDQRRREWCTFRLQILVQYWTARVNARCARGEELQGERTSLRGQALA